MKITQEIIQNLKPCEDRYNNFIEHYPNFSGNEIDFLSLENITHDDKVWVMTKLMTKEQNVKFAIQCSLSVLDIFEKEDPYDFRPRKAIEAAEKWLSNPTEENRLEAAYTAARAARAAAYTAARAARAAAYAAAYAAYAAAWAADAADAAAHTADGDVYAAYATINAVYAASHNKQQEELNLIFLKESL